jgi:hypothetical protein
VKFFTILFLIALGLAAQSDSALGAAKPQDWLQLFNGKNLDGWIPKIRGYPLGENFAGTFRVVDGKLSVNYEGYAYFAERFGHLFYEKEFSYYVLAVEYRFVGQQAREGPGWAVRNSGAMLHGQDPVTMGLNQDFPISIEAQFLGGLGKGKRSTANLCTPGTQVERDGKLFTPHCVNSESETFDGDQWVRVELEVHGGEWIEHRVNGVRVLRYERPQVGGGNVSGHRPEAKEDGKILTRGTISLQSESHPIEFRKVELLDLVGCLDKKSKKYRSYFVKGDDARCR